jgi:glutaminase
MAGSVDQSVWSGAGHRNGRRCNLLPNPGICQCAVLVTCRDLAVIGATLANMGRNPMTGTAVFDLVTVRSMLAIMFTCGMYDYSGEWAFRVGLPAKSGVSGGVMAVVNRQLGIATLLARRDRGVLRRSMVSTRSIA